MPTMPVVDQTPLPALLTARTSTSWESPLVRLVMVYSRSPEVQAGTTSFQFASALSDAVLRMERTS